MGLVDFTNPAALPWFGDKLRALLDTGVDCFKTDFGERIPTDVVYHDGSDPLKMHNYYTYLYNRAVFEVLRERRGEGKAVRLCPLGHRGQPEVPRSLGRRLLGDVRVHGGKPARRALARPVGLRILEPRHRRVREAHRPADVYRRWTAFGLLSSHSRLHGNESYRVPWLFGEESIDVLRFFANLKCRLMPYLYARRSRPHARASR